jgi:cbb3-type cytochrome oxidase maturation protein
MEILFLLIAFSLTLALIFLGGFYWAVKNKQYEDSYSPSVRILFDDLDPVSKKDATSTTITSTKNNKEEA